MQKTPLSGQEQPSADELIRQKELQAKLGRPKINFTPLAIYLCRYHNVSDVHKIVPFKKHPVCAWEVMSQATIGIEVGSVIKKNDQPPHVFQFQLEPEDSAEKQVVQCYFDPNSPWCRFLEKSPFPKQPFKNPVTGQPMPFDMDRVCVYNIVCKHIWSNVPINVAGRLNFYHKGINEMQQSEAQDNLFAAAGAVKGAFISIGRTPKEGQDINVVPMPALGFSCTNEFFTATMALINETNLMNGIIEIPHQVCLEANLPVYKGAPDPGEAFLASALEAMTLKDGHVTKVLSAEETVQARAKLTEQFKTKWDEETATKKKIQSFFAIPINHVLAWGLHSEDYMAQKGFHAEQFRFKPPATPEDKTPEPIVLYFLVGDVYFQHMLEEFKKTWMNKVDIRPMTSMAFEFVPELDRSRYPEIPADKTAVQGVMSLRSYIHYMVPPKLSQATINNLAPALSLNFPSCHEWSIDELAREMAIDRHFADAAVASKKK